MAIYILNNNELRNVNTTTFYSEGILERQYFDSIGSEINANNSLLEFLSWEEPQEDDFA